MPRHPIPYLILRHMFFKKTPMWSNRMQFANNTRISKLASCQPYFYYTEILLRGNSYSVNQRDKILICWHGFAHQHIGQLFPRLWHIFIANFIWKTSAVTIACIFPRRSNAFAHQEKHTIRNKFCRENIYNWDGFFNRGEWTDFNIAFNTPIGVMWKMSPQNPRIR